MLPLFLSLLLLESVAGQYTAGPRWGQATALVGNTLFVHGGRTDLYNSYSYTSAPVVNDLLALNLSSTFDTTSVPWQYVSGCSNCTSDQGPAVAWHTLDPFNTTDLLLFGGDPGPNSPIKLPVGADSAALLDTNTLWNYETTLWANEPTRRIYHSASSGRGKVWIVGGERADGSGSAFSEHYVFDPSVPSFTQLPSNDGPPDIFGHRSVMLSSGKLVVLGGYSPSSGLIPFSTVWQLDTTQSTPSWVTVSVDTSSLPTPRRGFAATLVAGDKILIHGGADAVLQTTYDDGWVLDTTVSPMKWMAVPELSQVGKRRDHFAVGLGNVTLFGFGYSENGAAPATIQVFDLSSNAFQSIYSPPSAITTPTATLPGSTPTNSPGSGVTLTSHGQNPTGSGEAGTATGTISGPKPTSSGHNGDGNDPSGQDPKSHTLTITLATVFGVVALLIAAMAVTYYMRHRSDSASSFHLLDGTGPGDEESSGRGTPAGIPMAGGHTTREKGLPLPPVVRTVKNKLGSVLPGYHPPYQPAERKDMLADEDTRRFDVPAWYANVHRGPSSGQSSWNPVRRPTLEKMYDSFQSLKSAGGAVLEYAAGAAAAAGARSFRSREPSVGSRSATWREKEPSYDMYTDEMGLIRPLYGNDSAYASEKPASRPRGGRRASSYSYTDPFQDYEVESLKIDDVYRDDDEFGRNMPLPSLLDPPSKPYIQTMLPPATVDLTRLSPLSEQPSVATITDPSTTDTSSNTSHNLPLSPLTSTTTPSSSTHDAPRRPSSILDANPSATLPQPIRRSNSWWTRFAKSPLLDRRSSDSRSQNRVLDIRDPNPPPRLNPIEEGQSQSNSPDSPTNKRQSGDSGGHKHDYSTLHHGRSATSLQTSRTVDSETLEKMGQYMQIVQQGSGSMGSHRSGPSVTSVEESIDPDIVRSRSRSPPTTGRPLSIVPSSQDHISSEALVLSPLEITTPEKTLPTPPSPARRSPTGAKVAARVQAYERRMSQPEETIKSRPTSAPPARTHRPSTYGLAPKAPLYVANPDHSPRGSGSSS